MVRYSSDSASAADVLQDGSSTGTVQSEHELGRGVPRHRVARRHLSRAAGGGGGGGVSGVSGLGGVRGVGVGGGVGGAVRELLPEEEDAANFAAGRVYVPDDSLSSGTMAAMIAAGALAVIAAAVALFYWRQSQAARDRRVSKLHMDKPPPATPVAAADLTHPLDVEGRQAAERRAGKLPPLQHRPPPTQPQPAADSLVAPTPWVQTGAGSGAGGGAAAQSDPVAALFGSVSGGSGSRDGDGNRTDGRSTFSTPTNAVQ